jgi:transposase
MTVLPGWERPPDGFGWWTGNDGLSHRMYSMRGGRTIMQKQDRPAVPVRAVAGIDAAVTARHHIAVREIFEDGTEQLSRFTVDPTLAGLDSLSRRLAALPVPVTAVVEPTSMTWLALTLAVERAGGQMSMVGARHSARLRGAIMGKNKSDVIDSEVLTHAGEIFDPPRLVLASPAQLALRRAVVRRHGAVIDGNRSWRRLMSLARWAFPDVWTAFAGSEATALAVLERWPHLRSLSSARAATLTAVVAAHTRDVGDTPARAAAIRDAARGWAGFWDGHLDLDALAVDVTEHLADLREARARVERFTAHSRQWWEHLWGDDPLVLSLPGVGPATGPCIRAYLGDGTGFDSAKKAANYVGITPSNWSSGTMNQPRRAISKEGPGPAASGVLPGSLRGPDHGPPAGRFLPPADDRKRSLPHPGRHRRGPETGRTDLENPHDRRDLPAPRP